METRIHDLFITVDDCGSLIITEGTKTIMIGTSEGTRFEALNHSMLMACSMTELLELNTKKKNNTTEKIKESVKEPKTEVKNENT